MVLQIGHMRWRMGTRYSSSGLPNLGSRAKIHQNDCLMSSTHNARSKNSFASWIYLRTLPKNRQRNNNSAAPEIKQSPFQIYINKPGVIKALKYYINSRNMCAPSAQVLYCFQKYWDRTSCFCEFNCLSYSTGFICL